MPSALQISHDFIAELLLPQLKRALPDAYDRLAVGIIGTGSDVLGLDDDISRDHHWGPRANVLYLGQDSEKVAARVRECFVSLPRRYREIELAVNVKNQTGVCAGTIEDFFIEFLGTAELPCCDSDWLKYCEVDLLHVTGGAMVYDGLGEMTRRRELLAYYPENLWKKRLADWCMYACGRDAPYNVHRVSKRGDLISSTIYFGLCAKRLMELCFMLNRRYAPYTKWLNRAFRQLPNYANEMADLLDRAFATSDWNARVHLLIDASYIVVGALADLGLTDRPPRNAFDEHLTDLILYHSASQIYSSLPRELLRPSFNQIEVWEKKAREVLFDENDYFRKS
jgi:Domain of unknown function (DUF4037)